MINNDELICEDIDVVMEARKNRTLPEVFIQWMDNVLGEVKAAKNPETIQLITRLGLLGQQLIFQANQIGMWDVVKMRKDLTR